MRERERKRERERGKGRGREGERERGRGEGERERGIINLRVKVHEIFVCVDFGVSLSHPQPSDPKWLTLLNDYFHIRAIRMIRSEWLRRLLDEFDGFLEGGVCLEHFFMKWYGLSNMSEGEQ
jgi:hypothetical protein